MKHTIEIGGEQRDIEINAMDEGFVVYRKMFAPPLTRENIGKVNLGDPEYLGPQLADGRFRVIEGFFRRQIQIVGSCMILAWEGEGVIGKMHFTTREMHDAMGGCVQYGGVYCVENDELCERIESLPEEEQERLLRSESRTLCVLCFNVGHSDERYQGQGIAKAMIEYLKRWAHTRGWRRIEAHSCPDIVPTTIVGDWMLRRSPFERRGFRVLEETFVSADEASRRLEEIEAYLGGKDGYPKWANRYADNVWRLAEDPTWRSEYDKNYLMACDV